MSPAAVPSGHDADALLLCDACGLLGPESKVYPHVGEGPECTAPLTLVSDGDAVSIGYVPGSGEVININRRAAELEAIAPDEVDELAAAAMSTPSEEFLDDDDEVDRADDEVDDEGSVTLTPGPRARVTASAKDGALRRRQPGRETQGMKLNAPRPGAVKVTRPEAITASVNVKVSLYTLSLFDVARNDGTLGFDGTLEEFLDQCPQALFKMMGFDGMYLLRQNHAIAKLEEAVDRIVGPRAVVRAEAS